MRADATVSATAPVLDEAAHLRQLLDRQPACLIRVAADASLLAVNDAALHLLGAEELKRVLGTKLTDGIAPEHHEAWNDFAVRVWQEQSGSIECDMIDRAGTRRTVQFKAVALTDHPDGLQSLLVSVRDTSVTQRLAQALEEHEAMRRVVDALDTKLTQARTLRERLQAEIAQRDAAHQQALNEQLRARLEAERALEEATARNEQLSSLLLTQGVDLQKTAKQLEQLAHCFVKAGRAE